MAQGFGYIFDYVARLHQGYGYSVDYCYYELNMDLGWLLYSWAQANDPVNRFNGIKFAVSPMSREVDSLKQQIKTFNKL